MLLKGTTKTIEVVVVVVVGVAEDIQMAVVVGVVAEEVVATKMVAANIMTNLKTIIQGIIIIIEEGMAGVVGTVIRIIVQQFRVVMVQLMLGWHHDV